MCTTASASFTDSFDVVVSELAARMSAGRHARAPAFGYTRNRFAPNQFIKRDTQAKQYANCVGMKTAK